MKSGEVRKYKNPWHCGVYLTANDCEKSDKEICHINSSKPFLILLIDKLYNNSSSNRFMIKILFEGKVGFIVASDELTEIVA